MSIITIVIVFGILGFALDNLDDNQLDGLEDSDDEFDPMID